MIRTGKNCKTHGRRRAAGFTLVELLVVIAIVALLSGILFPAIGRAKDLSRAAATQNRITSLDGACEMFKQDHGAYPGVNRWPVGSSDNYLLLNALDPGRRIFTGSQILTMCLLDMYAPGPQDKWISMSEHLAGTSEERPPRPYVDLGDDAVDDVDGSVTGVPYTLLDAFSEPMPILYFPARPGQNEWDDIYKFSDNEGSRGYPDSSYASDFGQAVRNGDSASNRPYREDSFLLVAPGIDRLWFNNDDNRNFNQ